MRNMLTAEQRRLILQKHINAEVQATVQAIQNPPISIKTSATKELSFWGVLLNPLSFTALLGTGLMIVATWNMSPVRPLSDSLDKHKEGKFKFIAKVIKASAKTGGSIVLENTSTKEVLSLRPTIKNMFIDSAFCEAEIVKTPDGAALTKCTSVQIKDAPMGTVISKQITWLGDSLTIRTTEGTYELDPNSVTKNIEGKKAYGDIVTGIVYSIK